MSKIAKKLTSCTGNHEVYEQEHFISRIDPCYRESPFPRSQFHGIHFQLSTTGLIIVCISQCLVTVAYTISTPTSSPKAESHLFKQWGQPWSVELHWYALLTGRWRHQGFINQSTTTVYQVNR